MRSAQQQPQSKELKSSSAPFNWDKIWIHYSSICTQMYVLIQYCVRVCLIFVIWWIWAIISMKFYFLCKFSRVRTYAFIQTYGRVFINSSLHCIGNVIVWYQMWLSFNVHDFFLLSYSWQFIQCMQASLRTMTMGIATAATKMCSLFSKYPGIEYFRFVFGTKKFSIWIWLGLDGLPF